MKLFTYELYHNIQHVQFKLDWYYANHSAEAQHESVVSLIINHEAIGINCAFKNYSLSPSFTLDNFYPPQLPFFVSQKGIVEG